MLAKGKVEIYTITSEHQNGHTGALHWVPGKSTAAIVFLQSKKRYDNCSSLAQTSGGIVHCERQGTITGPAMVEVDTITIFIDVKMHGATNLARDVMNGYVVA